MNANVHLLSAGAYDSKALSITFNSKPVPSEDYGLPAGTSRRLLQLVKDNYSWLSAILAVIVSTSGLLNLLLYTNYIGRPDVFLRSLEVGPSLILLWLVYFVLSILALGIMVCTSCVIVQIITWLQPAPQHSAAVLRNLLFTLALCVLAGISPVAINILFDADISYWPMLLVPLVAFAGALVTIGRCAAYCKSLSPSDTFKVRASKAFGLAVLLVMATLIAAFPLELSIIFYKEQASTADNIKLVMYMCLIMTGSAAPSVGYYWNMQKDRLTRIRTSIATTTLYLLVVLSFSPSLVSAPSIGAMKLLGIRDTHPKHYLIDNAAYPASSLNASMWAIKDSEAKKYRLTGYSLYSYGAVELICPPGLAEKRINEMDKHTHACIPFQRNSVTPLEAIATPAAPDAAP
ncbi:hypothetical protein [Pseudomonas sp. NBRC 111123]|uniref:hypothetical protein n=1 Tax=Pseudomonas sp. NBRC 111123 TaxID=1661038 RepID=UPI000760BB65|nr:hypothetical protein [Pseudomonas sp. NBRC 111123]